MATATSKKTDKKPAAPKAAAKPAPAKAKASVAVKPKPAAKPKSAAKPAAAKPKADKPVATGRPGHPVGEEQRRNYIEVAAYYIAERRGFAGGDALEDWATAEAEIDRLLTEGRLNP